MISAQHYSLLGGMYEGPKSPFNLLHLPMLQKLVYPRKNIPF